MKRKTKAIDCNQIIGDHSAIHHFEVLFSALDQYTDTGVAHRALSEQAGKRDVIVANIREMLIRHHVSPEALERDNERRAAISRLGFSSNQDKISRFPSNPSTQKGNLAEIVLAEYLVSSSGVDLPVYRLRYNPNIDQAMKGDDVLAFDLDSDPVRIIVGESKFRTASSKAAVIEIVKGLVRSHKGGVPVSLQFVADRLFEMGNVDLGKKVSDCAILFALDKLQLDYVGLLMSDPRSSEMINKHAENLIHRLALISLNIESPDAIVIACFKDLE